MFRPLIVLISLALIGILTGCRPQVSVNANVNVRGRVNANTNTSVNTNASGNPSTQGFARLGPNAVYVADQRPGRTVIVGVVNLSASGYAVVHRDDDGKPGEEIGRSTLLQAGEHTKVSVALDEAVSDNDQLIVALHRDDGDGRYDAAKDTALQDAAGNDIWMVTMVDVEASDPATVQVNF